MGCPRAIDAVYRFLASLKLAVISLSSLAAALAYATFFESSYGTAAAQDYVYQSTWFAVLLAFLAINILCAALIRFPWKKRQTGFVITHAGLLVLIFGSYCSFKTADEGMVGMLEGESRASWCAGRRPGDPRPGARPAHPGSHGEYDLPFKPGPFPWGSGQAHLHGMLDLVLSCALRRQRCPVPLPDGRDAQPAGRPVQAGGARSTCPPRRPRVLHQADPAGDPMAKIQLQFKAPGMPQARDAFATEDEQWFKLERRFYRVARTEACRRRSTFAYVDRPELVEDFLKPPMIAGPRGVARFRYPDNVGQDPGLRLAARRAGGQDGRRCPTAT